MGICLGSVACAKVAPEATTNDDGGPSIDAVLPIADAIGLADDGVDVAPDLGADSEDDAPAAPKGLRVLAAAGDVVGVTADDDAMVVIAGDLFAVSIETSRATRIAPWHGGARISGHVVFIYDGGTLSAWSRASGFHLLGKAAPALLAHAAAAEDGSRVTWLDGGPDSVRFYFAAADGTDVTHVDATIYSKCLDSAHPARVVGHVVHQTLCDGLEAFDLATGKRTIWLEDVTDSFPDPRGARLVAFTPKFETILLDYDSPTRAATVYTDSSTLAGAALFLPDGAGIVFGSTDGVFRYDFEPAAISRLGAPGPLTKGNLSRDGAWIAHQSGSTGAPSLELVGASGFVVPTFAGASLARPILVDDELVQEAFTADCGALIYTTDGRKRLHVYELGGLFDSTFEIGESIGAIRSTSGRQIVFETTTLGIYELDLLGLGPLQKLGRLRSTSTPEPSWFLDRAKRTVVFTDPTRDAVVAVPLGVP